MKPLMNKPKDCLSYPFFVLDDDIQEIMKGDMISHMFYNRGIWRENFIPFELKNWKPEENTKYKVWYHCTNPADPADPGDYYLDYIEEV